MQMSRSNSTYGILLNIALRILTIYNCTESGNLVLQLKLHSMQ